VTSITVEFHRWAAKEMHAARQWYAQRSTVIADRFKAAVDVAVQKIQENPDGWPRYRSDYHWVKTQRFPYLLFYHILSPTRVIVLAVAHARRRPGYWVRRRLPP
jgi:plasmid stabilization system protein ParE